MYREEVEKFEKGNIEVLLLMEDEKIFKNLEKKCGGLIMGIN